MKNQHPSSHDIDTSYLLELKQFYENKFLYWVGLETDIVELTARLDIRLHLYKGDKNSTQYLELSEIIAKLRELKDAVSSFMFQHQKLKYKCKELSIDNSRLREQNELLQKQLLAMQRFNNV